MINQKIKFTNDTIILIDFLLIMATGFVLKFMGGRETFLYLFRSEWAGIHFYASILLCVLIIIHLTLNWNWIVMMFKFNLRSPREL